MQTLSMKEEESRIHALYEDMGRKGEIDYDCVVWADTVIRHAFTSFTGGELIDVGCGYGRFVPVLPDIGVEAEDYLGIDFSEEQVKLARRLYPRLRFEVASIYEVGNRYSSRFSGFLCTAMFMHIPRARMKDALSSLRHCLKDGAVGLLSTPEGIEGCLEFRTPEGLLNTNYTEDELWSGLHDAGFDAEIFSAGGMLLACIKTK